MAERRDTCGNCRAFDFTAGSWGECRRKSPAETNHNGEGLWPDVKHEDWCLEHVPAPITRKTLVNPVK